MASGNRLDGNQGISTLFLTCADEAEDILTASLLSPQATKWKLSDGSKNTSLLSEAIHPELQSSVNLLELNPSSR